MKALYVVVLLALSGCSPTSGSVFGPHPPPTHLDIRESALTIAEGRGARVSVAIDHCVPLDYCIMWVSSNECVAGGAGAAITGGHFGSAMLRAIAVENPAVRDSVQVTVTAATPRALRFDADSMALPAGADRMAPIRILDSSGIQLMRAPTFRTDDSTIARVVASPGCDGLYANPDIFGVRHGTTLVTAQFGTLVDTIRVRVQ